MLLKLGSKGDDVVKLQQKLGVDPVGNFGPKTEAAVKAWQKANGLKDDGIVGDITWNKLFSVSQSTVQESGADPLGLAKLKGKLPDSVLSQIPEIVKKFNCTTKLRLAHFLAQCEHESGGFKAVSENLNYSASGLLKTFPKYFNETTAAQYQKKPEMIASKVYGNRMGNGDESTKEGYKFRGRGYIQLTGKSNYSRFAQFIGEDAVSNPDLVANKYPLASAAFFFDSNKLWSICDEGSSDSVVTKVTKRVNGGTLGLADRLDHFKQYYAILTS